MGQDEPRSGELAIRKVGQLPERQEFAEHLRFLFSRLETSYRSYEKLRNVTPSALSRYLNGGRVPTKRFVEDLFDDLEAAGFVVAVAERDLVHSRREAALRNGNKVQQLHVQLEEAQQDLVGLREREERLARDLSDREGALAELDRQLRLLNEAQDLERRSQASALTEFLQEYERLEEERDRLRDEVDGLRREVLRERVRALKSEEQCRLLAWQLQDAGEMLQAGGSFDSLVQNLDKAPVPDLVALVAGADAEHAGIAAELVRSVGQRRPIADVVALFVALRDAGGKHHADLTLPAAVVARSVEDVSALVEGFHLEGLDAYTSIVVRTAVEVFAAQSVTDLILRLHMRGFHEPAESLAVAAAVCRPVAEVVSNLIVLEQYGLHGMALTALHMAARERSVPELVNLIEDLETAGLSDFCHALLIAPRAVRSATEVADLLTRLEACGLTWLADSAFEDITQYGSADAVVAVISALHTVDRHERATIARNQAVTHRSAEDVAVLIAGFHAAEYHSHAAEAMSDFLRGRGIEDRVALFAAFSSVSKDKVADKILRHAALTLPWHTVGSLIIDLDLCGLHGQAELMLTASAEDRPPRDVADMLAALPSSIARRDIVDPALFNAAQTRTFQDLAALIVALQLYGLPGYIDVLLRSTESDGPHSRIELQDALQKQLSKRTHRPSLWASAEGLNVSDQTEQGEKTELRLNAGRRLWNYLFEPVSGPPKRELLRERLELRQSCVKADEEVANLRLQLEVEIIRREAAEARATATE